jgi:hypothetical protein
LFLVLDLLTCQSVFGRASSVCASLCPCLRRLCVLFGRTCLLHFNPIVSMAQRKRHTASSSLLHFLSVNSCERELKNGEHSLSLLSRIVIRIYLGLSTGTAAGMLSTLDSLNIGSSFSRQLFRPLGVVSLCVWCLSPRFGATMSVLDCASISSLSNGEFRVHSLMCPNGGTHLSHELRFSRELAACLSMPLCVLEVAYLCLAVHFSVTVYVWSVSFT